MSKHTPVAVTLGTALAGLALSGATFAMQPLAQGYMLAASEPVATMKPYSASTPRTATAAMVKSSFMSTLEKYSMTANRKTVLRRVFRA